MFIYLCSQHIAWLMYTHAFWHRKMLWILQINPKNSALFLNTNILIYLLIINFEAEILENMIVRPKCQLICIGQTWRLSWIALSLGKPTLFICLNSNVDDQSCITDVGLHIIWGAVSHRLSAFPWLTMTNTSSKMLCLSNIWYNITVAIVLNQFYVALLCISSVLNINVYSWAYYLYYCCTRIFIDFTFLHAFEIQIRFSSIICDQNNNNQTNLPIALKCKNCMALTGYNE